MKLFDRVAMLIKADAHGVVESLEERTLLLKQYVREAELELNRKRARLDAVRDDERRLVDALARVESERSGLDEDVELALSGGREDLARFAIRRLIPLRSEAVNLGEQIEQRRGETQALAERVAVQQAQLDDLRTRVRAELTRAAEHTATPPWAGVAAVADEEVELELMRRRGERVAP